MQATNAAKEKFILFFYFRPTETSHGICLEMQYSDTSLLKSQEREEQTTWHRRSTSLQKKKKRDTRKVK